MKLADFEDRALDLWFDGNIHHPFQHTVVGRLGFDDADRRAAVFPRDPDEHYFRKYEGYAISVPVLRSVYDQGVRVVYIAEQHDDDADKRIIEYDIAEFTSGSLIAYSPSENTIVEGETAVEHADDRTFSDKQRVVHDDNARRVWSWDEFEVHL